MSFPKAVVEQLSRDGVSLVSIIVSGRKYGEAVQIEALRQLHVGVRSLRAYDEPSSNLEEGEEAS